MNLPNLSNEKLICVDVETRDERLKTHGPGGVRKDGYVVGVAVATRDWSTYLPFRHEGGDNLDLKRIKPWLKRTLGSKAPKLGANLSYDMEWCRVEGFPINGPKYDVQVAEALLDEDRYKYNLDSLVHDYEVGEKKLGTLEDALKLTGIKYDDPREVLWKLPGGLVSPYAQGDVTLPFQVWDKQVERLKDENLWSCFEVESKLLDVLLEMRFLGVRVDIDRAEQVAKRLEREYKTILRRLKNLAGEYVDVWSGQQIAKMFDRMKIKYPRTEKGNPSVKAEWLENQDGEIFELIRRARKVDRGGSVYVRDKILNMAVDGRVYASFHSTKNDRHGTGAGRFSCSNPNLQQVPSRDQYLAPLVRSIFVPEDGCPWWKFDYSQQEYRVMVHYAYRFKLPGSGVARKMFVENPKTDFHQMVADLAKIERKAAKNINFGLIYGMGKAKLCRSLGLTSAEGDALFNTYHGAVPYVKALKKYVERVATRRGYITMYDGRRKRFQFWGPPEWSDDVTPMRKVEALAAYGAPVKRYFIHKSLNNLVQGTSAGMNKKALLTCFEAGYLPCLTVHDENDFPNLTSEKQAREIKQIHEDAFQLEVPILCDAERGDNWGDVEAVEL